MMEIKFSRHARRRAKLYQIPQSMIEEVLAEVIPIQGHHEIVTELPHREYPVKVVFAVEKQTMTVITTYPLKKTLSLKLVL